jgi:putative hydrolase of the HAD superfamily
MILVLDLDGVVVLGHPDGGRWDKNISRDLGIDAARLQTVFFKPFFERIVCGDADLHATLRAIWPALQCNASPEQFVEYWFSMDSRVDRSLLERVDDWRSKGRCAFLATNQEHSRARYVWGELSLASRFDGMIYSAAVRARKPDLDFFHRARSKLSGVEGRDILFLDDSDDNVRAASNAGWNSFHYCGIESLDAALATVDRANS